MIKLEPLIFDIPFKLNYKGINLNESHIQHLNLRGLGGEGN